MIYSQVREYIVIPVLKQMSIPYSEEAVELLLMTIAHESNGGEYIKQIEGPACGIYQMEPATYTDIWNNYLDYRQDLKEDVELWSFGIYRGVEQDIGNMYYATAMARIHYWRVSEALPKQTDYQPHQGMDFLAALARYCKAYYNTHLGKATPEKYLTDYLRWRNANE
jgi:hypothetical protein